MNSTSKERNRRSEQKKMLNGRTRITLWVADDVLKIIDEKVENSGVMTQRGDYFNHLVRRKNPTSKRR